MTQRWLVLLILFGAVLYVWHLHVETQTETALKGRAAPDFMVEDEKGNKARLSSLAGKVVLLHFWASWCPPCREEFPSLDRLQKDFAEKPFILLAVSMDEKKEDVIAFRKRVPFDFPVYFDPAGDLAGSYGVFVLPETFLIDKGGIVQTIAVGPQGWQKEKWVEKIEELVSR